jgi:glutamate-5-semialdehyde dehydrogenase
MRSVCRFSGVNGVRAHVEHAASTAAAAASGLRTASDACVDTVLREMAILIERHADGVLSANAEDVEAARGALYPAALDRLMLDRARLDDIATQVRALAALQAVVSLESQSDVDGLVVETRRIPIGVVGANYEARANVTVDIASQLIKSRNAGVLRTGGAALRTASALVDLVVGPALAVGGVPGQVIQLVRTPAHEGAAALVSLPRLIPLVILRGSGETTALLAREAAAHGVRTLAHAEGGGVLYVHASAIAERALKLIEASLDRLGVCNRLNLLLIDEPVWEQMVPRVQRLLGRLQIDSSLPPHDHALGYEWALDTRRAATITIAAVQGSRAAAELANQETSGLAATVVAEDEPAAREFIDSYQGTGVFWNATTRLLDGFRLFGAPETGINVDRVPGPRGPVTYRDLHLRQVVVTSAGVGGDTRRS